MPAPIIPPRFNREADDTAPRISEPFSIELLGDIAALTLEDHITTRRILRTYDDEELQDLKDSVNCLNRQIDMVRSARRKQVTKENEIAQTS